MSVQTREMPVSLRVAAVGILTALTFVIGYVRVPLPATQGIFTLADIAIFLAAFTFGPFSAAVAGGAGAALIDLIGGTAQYAPVSLVVHGVEGLAAGFIAAAGLNRRGEPLAWVFAAIAGIVVLMGGYFAAEILFFGGFATALTEVLPNLGQGVTGAVGGALLCLAVRRAYPPVQALRW
jgi:uncharacterized membrane protein